MSARIDMAAAYEALDKPCPKCGKELTMWTICGVPVCDGCGWHFGIVRCFCGWAADGGDGRQQLRDLGENVDDES